MNFTLHLPNGYQRQPLPGLDEWVDDLRANPDQQRRGILGYPQGGNCCLGRFSMLQGRLGDHGLDGNDDVGDGIVLSDNNPVAPYFGRCGVFPDGVWVEIENDLSQRYNLGQCNDAGLTFPQIATIIESVWYNSGPILK